LWSSFSGTVKYHIKNLDFINSIRGLRYFGPSKMSLINLVIHSISIIAVFKRIVFLRSVILIIIFSYLSSTIPTVAATFQILLVVFNLFVYLVSLRENKESFENSEANEKSSTTYTH
jgi:hypothetical protein